MGLPGGRALYTGKNAYASQGFENDTRLGLKVLGDRITALAATVAAGLARILSSQVFGVVDGSNAPSGGIGEYVESKSGFVGSWTNGVVKTITSVSLTAGDWDVTGVVLFANGPITGSECLASISLTNNGFDDTLAITAIPLVPAAGLDMRIPCFTRRISITTTTTVYIVAREGFTAGTPANAAWIRARRVR